MRRFIIYRCLAAYIILVAFFSCALTHAQPVKDNESALQQRPVVFLQDDSGQPQPDGAYHFIVFSNAENIKAARLWIARSTTPDFQNAQWEAIPLQPATELAHIYKLAQKAAVPVGPPNLKFLAAKGEIEITNANGAKESHFSAVTSLPKVRAWTLKKPDGSRTVYAQPSEKAAQLQLWMARSATRDFQNAPWEKVPVTAPDTANTWQNFSAPALASMKDKPYIAVYGEAQFGDGAKGARIVSEKVIWNSLPLPKNATQITTNVCPLHGTNQGVVPVIYGLPGVGGPKDAVFAGCIVGSGSPIWHCRLCDCDWGDAMKQMPQTHN